MIHMINTLMGNEMYVHEDRVEEYLAAGHKLAADPSPEVEVKKREKKTRKRKE